MSDDVTIGIFFIVMVVIASAGVWVWENEPIIKTTIATDHIKLHAMKDNMYLSGRFYFLGGGNVETKWQYTYYYDPGNGMLKMGAIDADITSINEQYSKTPMLDTFYTTETGEWTHAEHAWYATAIATVPPGSVDNSYNMNAE